MLEVANVVSQIYIICNLKDDRAQLMDLLGCYVRDVCLVKDLVQTMVKYTCL